jgi:hypothetical protein
MKYLIRKGDLIKYRSRRPTDPKPTGTKRDAWGEMGVVVKVVYWNDDSENPDAVEFFSQNGDFSIAKMKDIEILRSRDD